MKQRFRTGGLAAWCLRRPVAVTMLALAVVVLGVFSLGRLGVDLLPRLIYPEIGVRVIDPGVPARVMEDDVTRQLEEQLAITEGAIAIQSRTSEGRSAVDLSFPYGTDIDIALRDASSRLDRAKRFLPDTIEPPVIFKRDPAQIPVLEFAVSSQRRDPVALRTWVDYQFAPWFLNLPGVAAVEVGGGLEREIQVLVDPERLAASGWDLLGLSRLLGQENREIPGGRVEAPQREFSARTLGRITSVEELADLVLWREPAGGRLEPASVRLRQVARVIDGHEDERLRIRLNGVGGVKVSVQKQPQANTVKVVDAVHERLAWMRAQGLVAGDVTVSPVGDQSTYVRHSLRNAALAALAGAALAMIVVYVFLGDLRRTLIIGTAIPLALFVTFLLMDGAGLTLNMMSLGGLALGVGMLVDNTIVMLENIVRHQRQGEAPDEAPVRAAAEVNSALVAATSTSLAAVLPFLFVGGLVGLLFRELIVTISAAVLASLAVALTVVPAYAARVSDRPGATRERGVDRALARVQVHYRRALDAVLQRPGRVLVGLLVLWLGAAWWLYQARGIFMPSMDEGRVHVSVIADPGTRLDAFDQTMRTLEDFLRAQPEVVTVFTQSGGFVFGRSEYQASNRGSITVQLVPVSAREETTDAWVERVQRAIAENLSAGVTVRMYVSGVRGLRLGRGDEDFSLRVQGDDLTMLARIGDEIVARLAGLPGLRNLSHTYEELREEIIVRVDRDRAGALGVSAEEIGETVRIALDGVVVSDYVEGDRRFDLRLRLPPGSVAAPGDLADVIVRVRDGQPIRLRDVGRIEIAPEPPTIQRDQQRRIVEVTGSLAGDADLGAVTAAAMQRLGDLALPEGYTLYEGGAVKTLQEGRRMGAVLVALALFLVFVVMAVQYESLRNPLVILLSAPFALIGVALVMAVLQMPLSMPVWLGLIMLIGIVVNNAIVLVEQVEIEREGGRGVDDAVREAARLRLRPVLMTALTTVIGMSPLALGLGEGAELLQPLAVVVVAGLSFSLLVSLLIVPALYRLAHR